MSTILCSVLLCVSLFINCGEALPNPEFDTNRFKESEYFESLARKINTHHELRWTATFGTIKSYNHGKDNVFSTESNLTINSTYSTLRSKRQLYLPATIDWRRNGKVSPPEHQGACGSCWAFSSVHTLMDNIRIHENTNTLFLSTQHVLECCMSQACGGCAGASDNAAGFDFLSRKFTVLQSCKSYSYYGDSTVNLAYSSPGQQCSEYCDNRSPILGPLVAKFRMINFERLNSNVHQIRAALNSGPLLTAVQLFADLYLYRSGIYRHVYGPFLGYHSVEMVGYGNEAGQAFWIIKNSWGQTWGEGGYFRIAAGNNEAKIEEHVIKPIFSGQQHDRGFDEAFSAPVGGSTDSNIDDPDIQEVSNFIAHEVKPLCRDGKLDSQDVESIQDGGNIQC